jgi:prolyl-tRNA synthetase
MATFDAVLETLSKLSVSPKSVSHDAVSDNKAWTEALNNTNDVTFEITKTLILKPKTAKTAPVTPVVVVALDATETNATALGKKLSLKDCRFANEDLLKETFQVTKEAVSPFALSNVQDLSLIHLVVDSAVLALPDTTYLAFHPSAADKTVFISVEELKSYLASISKEYVEIDFKALAAAKPPAAAAKKPAKAPKAKAEG